MALALVQHAKLVIHLGNTNKQLRAGLKGLIPTAYTGNSKRLSELLVFSFYFCAKLSVPPVLTLEGRSADRFI
jgi:hypothetical protein